MKKKKDGPPSEVARSADKFTQLTVNYLNKLLRQDREAISKLFDKCATTETKQLKSSGDVHLEHLCDADFITVLALINGILRSQSDVRTSVGPIAVLYDRPGSMRIAKFVVAQQRQRKACKEPATRPPSGRSKRSSGGTVLKKRRKSPSR